MRSRAAVALVVLTAGGAAVIIRADPQDTFRARVDVVNVDVAVKDGRRPIKGLKSEDFVLLDEGVPQTIDAVSVETLPIDVTLILDVSGSVDGQTLQGLKNAVSAAAGHLTKRDNVRLIAVSHQLREVFDFQPGGSSKIQALSDLRAGGGTSLYDGIVAALMSVRPPDRRHLIVVLTDGNDTASALPSTAVLEVAKRTDAVVAIVSAQYSVPIGNVVVVRSGAEPVLTSNGGALGRIAAATGGSGVSVLAIGASFNLSNVFKDAIDDFRTSYLVRYTSTVKQPGWHNIVVKVPKSDRYRVLARSGYVQ